MTDDLRFIATLHPPGSFFGPPWPSGICEHGTQVETPVGYLCLYCDEDIEQGQQGTFVFCPEGQAPVHKECSLREVLGGIGHFEDHDYWCVGPGGDTDGGRSFRQSALEVWAGFQSGELWMREPSDRSE